MDLGLSLIANAVVLIFILSISGIIGRVSDDTNKKVMIFYGVLFGFTAVLLMNISWGWESGVFYDSRTILYAIVGVMFNPLVTIISIIIGSLYRVYTGGLGTLAGVVTIIGTGSIGIITRTYIRPHLKRFRVVDVLIYGLVIHIFMLLYHFFLPADLSFIFERIGLIAPIVLTVYPIMVTIGIAIIVNNNRRIKDHLNLRINEEKYRNLFDGVNNGILVYDKNGIVTNCNTKYLELSQASRETTIGMDLTKRDAEIVKGLLESLEGKQGTFKGWHTTLESEVNLYMEVSFSPLFDNDEMIGGVALFTDLTETETQQKALEEIANKDQLTGFKNRKAYEEALFEKVFDSIHPVDYLLYSIDNYQFYSDTLSFQKLNDVVLYVSNQIKNEFKTAEHIYRLNQSDFVVILPRTTNEEIYKRANTVKHSINVKPYNGIDLQISLSIEHKESAHTRWSRITNTARSKIESIRRYSETSINMNSINLLLASLFEKSQREKVHSDRVSALAYELGKSAGLDESRLNMIKTAAVLHDIGKINIPLTILDKPDKLLDEEYSQIKNHALIGYRILASVKEYQDIAEIVLSHHERVDGMGYPQGIVKDQIPIESRIITICDTYDAMTHDRPYRKALSKEEAIQELIDFSNRQFDAELVKKFIPIVKRVS